jgi:hypothetical protein
MCQPETHVAEELLKKMKNCRSNSTLSSEYREDKIAPKVTSAFWMNSVSNNAYNTRPSPYNFGRRSSTSLPTALPAREMSRIKQLMENFGEILLDDFQDVYKAQYDEGLDPLKYGFSSLEDALLAAKTSCFLYYNVYKHIYTVRKYIPKKVLKTSTLDYKLDRAQKYKFPSVSQAAIMDSLSDSFASPGDFVANDSRNSNTPSPLIAASVSTESSPMSCSPVTDQTFSIEPSQPIRDPRIQRCRSAVLSKGLPAAANRPESSATDRAPTNEFRTMDTLSKNNLELVPYKYSRLQPSQKVKASEPPVAMTSSKADELKADELKAETDIAKLKAKCLSKSLAEFIQLEVAKVSKEPRKAIMPPEPISEPLFDKINTTSSFQTPHLNVDYCKDIIKEIAEEHVTAITLERLCAEYHKKTGLELLNSKLDEKQKMQKLQSFSGIFQVIEANSAFNLTDQHLLMNSNRLKTNPLKKSLYGKDDPTIVISSNDLWGKELRTELFRVLMGAKEPMLVTDIVPVFQKFYTAQSLQRRGRCYSKHLLRLSKLLPIEIMFNGTNVTVSLIQKHVETYLRRPNIGTDVNLITLFNLNSNVKFINTPIPEVVFEKLLGSSTLCSRWFRVKIGEAVDSNCVYIYLDKNAELDELMFKMQTEYNTLNQKGIMIPPALIKRGLNCVAKSTDGRWMRVQIVNVFNGTDKVFIESIDFGERKVVDHKDLRFLMNSFELLNAQAIRVRLAYVKTTDLTSHEKIKKAILKYKSKNTSLFCNVISAPTSDNSSEPEKLAANSRAKYSVLLCKKELELQPITVNEKLVTKFVADPEVAQKKAEHEITPLVVESANANDIEVAEDIEIPVTEEASGLSDSLVEFAENQLEITFDQQNKRPTKKSKQIEQEKQPIQINCYGCIKRVGSVRLISKKMKQNIVILNIRGKLYIQDSDITPLVKTTFWKFVSNLNLF